MYRMNTETISALMTCANGRSSNIAPFLHQNMEFIFKISPPELKIIISSDSFFTFSFKQNNRRGITAHSVMLYDFI